MSPTRLGMFLDGELPQEQRRIVASHLDGCLGCREWFQQNQAVAAAVTGLPLQEAPAELWPAIAARLEALPRPNARRRFIPWAVAAGLVLGLVGWLAWGWLGRSAAPDGPAVMDLSLLMAALPHGPSNAEETFAGHYQSRRIDRQAARAWADLRLRLQAELPGELKLVSLRKLSVHGHEALFLRYSGGGHEMIVMQCPADLRMQCNARYCQHCTGGLCECRVMTFGRWRLVRLADERACYGLVTTIGDGQLQRCLDALGIHQRFAPLAIPGNLNGPEGRRIQGLVDRQERGP